MKRIINFLRYNQDKRTTILIWLWTAIYRLSMLLIPAKYMKKHYGTPEEETPLVETREHYFMAKKIAKHVNRIADHTPWESKCLVRALTAQKMLRKEKIPSTLYLGVAKKEGVMVAHAWIRIGSYCLTGGNGSEYVVVAKFRR